MRRVKIFMSFALIVWLFAIGVSCTDNNSLGSGVKKDNLSGSEGDGNIESLTDDDTNAAGVSASPDLYAYRKQPEYQKALQQVLEISPKENADQSAAPAFPAEFGKEALKVIDRRQWAQQKTIENRNSDIKETVRSEKAFYQRAVMRAKDQGVDIEKHPQLKLLAIKAGMNFTPSADEKKNTVKKTGMKKNDLPVPGGVGYGTYYQNNSLIWSTDTLLAENLIVPRTPGGDVTGYLYNTSSNRSNLGVESFISYYAQDDARFKVFDWARPSAEYWQIDLSYSDISNYLINTQTDDGKWRQELRLYNYTNKTSTNNWYNAVWLWNNVTDNWDLIYVYYYTTINETDNTYQPGEHYGSWGPIFETFQDHNGTNKPIGHHSTFIYQDGVSRWLDSSNSYLVNNDPDLNPPIFLTPYSGWAVGTAISETASTMVEAENMSHYVGYASGEGWRADPAGGAGWITWGGSTLFGTGLSGQRYVFQMDVKVDSTASASDVLFYGLFDAISGNYVDYRWIRPSDFYAADNYQSFRFETVLSGDKFLFPLAYYYGAASVTIDRFSLALD